MTPLEGTVADFQITKLLDGSVFTFLTRFKAVREDLDVVSVAALTRFDEAGMIGVHAGKDQAVFEPFHRAERSPSRETGGAGLGQTVARQATRAFGGDVVLANRDAGGLIARLSLPLAAGD